MTDASKWVDALVKAPLWLFFAATAFFGAPLLNLDFLADAGVKNTQMIGPIPTAQLFVGSAALFLSSLMARCWKPVFALASWIVDRSAWAFRILTLDRRGRALLSLAEDDAMTWLYLLPDSDGVRELRSKGLLIARLVGDDHSWGQFNFTQGFLRAVHRHPQLMRRLLKVRPDELVAARENRSRAHRAGKRPGRA